MVPGIVYTENVKNNFFFHSLVLCHFFGDYGKQQKLGVLIRTITSHTADVFFRWLNTSSTGFYSIYVLFFLLFSVNEETHYFHVLKKKQGIKIYTIFFVDI